MPRSICRERYSWSSLNTWQGNAFQNAMTAACFLSGTCASCEVLMDQTHWIKSSPWSLIPAPEATFVFFSHSPRVTLKLARGRGHLALSGSLLPLPPSQPLGSSPASGRVWAWPGFETVWVSSCASWPPPSPPCWGTESIPGACQGCGHLPGLSQSFREQTEVPCWRLPRRKEQGLGFPAMLSLSIFSCWPAPSSSTDSLEPAGSSHTALPGHSPASALPFAAGGRHRWVRHSRAGLPEAISRYQVYSTFSSALQSSFSSPAQIAQMSFV